MRKHNDIVCRTMDYEDCVCETIYHADRIKALDLFELIFERYPKPAAWLLTLRDHLVKPFGLKTGSRFRSMILEEDDAHVLLGQEDKHLDFYVLLECSYPFGSWQDVRVRTLVRYHNLLGKVYFCGIRVFHVILVQALSKRAVRIWMRGHAKRQW